jgi:hypothetical protein
MDNRLNPHGHKILYQVPGNEGVVSLPWCSTQWYTAHRIKQQTREQVDLEYELGDEQAPERQVKVCPQANLPN